MKAAIIGAGNVGKAVFHDLQRVNLIREITLIARNKAKVEAEVVDAKDAIIICVTNPLDVITMKIQQVTGRDARKVIGTGTLLDTARLVRFVAELLEVSDHQLYIPVVGEHGVAASVLSIIGRNGIEDILEQTRHAIPLL